MKNEKRITLVELLAAVVIVEIIVPLLTIITGTFTRAVSQEKETEIAYVVQEVMEKVRLHYQWEACKKSRFCYVLSSACNPVECRYAYC